MVPVGRLHRDGQLAVSYYDRQYGNDELTGESDFSLSGSTDLARFAPAGHDVVDAAADAVRGALLG